MEDFPWNDIFCDLKMINLAESKKDHYGFFVKDTTIYENQILRFNGENLLGRSFNDVTCIIFQNCSITKIPQNLIPIFPNLEILMVQNSGLKNICRDDIVEYKNLKLFNCIYNEIEYLPGDLFNGFKNLELISFRENKITLIEPNLLDGLDRIRCVNFCKNVNYDIRFSNYKDDFTSLTPDRFKEQLKMKYPSKIRELTNSEARLKAHNEDLDNQIQKLTINKLENCKRLENLEMELQKMKSLELELEKVRNQSQNSFIADIKSYIQDDSTKDFKIKISDKTFSVHKFILAVRSLTLAEILQKNPEANELNLVDISVEIFEKILDFFYNDKLPNDHEDIPELLCIFTAASRLKIAKLVDFVSIKISEQLDADNAIEVLKFSSKYDNQGFIEKIFEKIKMIFPEIPFKEAWKDDADKIVKAIELFQ